MMSLWRSTVSLGNQLYFLPVNGGPLRSVTSDAQTKQYKMKSKNAAKKRLRVTARGDIKLFPSYLGGRSRRIVKTRAKALEKQLPKLLPHRTRLTRAYRRTGPTMGAFWHPTFAWTGLGDEPVTNASYRTDNE
jgi:ribosomal protein L35